MKFPIRMLAMILGAALLLGACSAGGTTQPSETVQPETNQPETTQGTEALSGDALILAQRRDIVEAHMRKQLTVLWRSTEDIHYTKTAGDDAPVEIVKGRLYQGIPYTQASTGLNAFLDYAVSQDSNGIYTVSGLTADSLNGIGSQNRISSDCSSTVWLAWNQVSTSIPVNKTATKAMAVGNGYLRVGEYESDETKNENTKGTCQNNGAAVMNAAYAQLQKGDAVVMNNNGAGHVMMVVSNNVVERNGKISAIQSYVTIIDQTSAHHRGEKSYYDETLKEDVYYIGGVDKVYSYQQLFQSGYLPITIQELVDPAPVEDEWVKDSITAPSKENMFEGTITTNRAVESVTITIAGADGKTVQEATCYGVRSKLRKFELSLFTTENPTVIRGSIALDKLPAGTYRCTYTVRTAMGTKLNTRDFEFTV